MRMNAAFPPLANAMATAQWLAHRYDPGHDAFHFVDVPRAHHAAIPFLTDDNLPSAGSPLIVRRSDAMTLAPPPGPIHFIFHSAYCCSTLLAAAVDLPGIAMGLKEPVLLNDIVGWRHRGAKGPDVARVLDESLRLLARPFAMGEAIVVKPSNIVNPLIPAIMALRPDARAVLLHAPLDAYLASIARKGLAGRLWVRDLFGKLMNEGMLKALGIAPTDYLGLTDIQVAAAGWLAQQLQFQSLCDKLGSRVATLNSDVLISRPQDVLASLAKLFDLAIDADTIAAIVSGPVFTRDAKTGSEFGTGQRQRDAQQAISLYADEVEKVGHWARVIAHNIGISEALPRPLLP
ncbi:hypothetical protein [Sphingobium sp. D43FB]|uniref:hypothetical protein n=1 Tax=Sphingobium sp. D43FB TaxID=2017595 RepID=UPI0020D18362|nr:hypothetical protein [Sphingobium sp. D43FB]